jgi:hypothetical protein
MFFIEKAWEKGKVIGLRLTITATGQTLLIFADQAAMPGFREGKGFVPSYGSEITYYYEHSCDINA